MTTVLKNVKGWVLALVAGLTLAAGAGAAMAAQPTPTGETQTVASEQSATNVAGPYYTYARALDVADSLEDLGFYTSVVYRHGYWWVLYS